tara:strand:+ start:282 stop:1031 length:750 start_codon:yes stop_codon:yes gene_type:complete
MAKSKSNRSKVIDEIRNILGDGMVDVELDPKHYETALDLAVDRFRQRSSNANEEATLFLSLLQDINEYTLPNEVIEVREIFRRALGSDQQSGIDVDPFEIAYTNLYFLQAGRIGGLTTWEAFSQYQETVGRLFGNKLNFTWDTVTKKITIVRRPRNTETVLLQVYMKRTDETLLDDPYAKPWLRDYALAQCKMMLGEARSKFGQLPGAQGGVTLNGADLKAEAQATLDRLEDEIQKYSDGGDPITFLIG